MMMKRLIILRLGPDCKEGRVGVMSLLSPAESSTHRCALKSEVEAPTRPVRTDAFTALGEQGGRGAAAAITANRLHSQKTFRQSQV